MREQRRIDQPRPVRASPVFHFEYIRRIPAELASLKRREHGGFIHYRTTTGVYKQSARPYEGKQLGVDQMLGIGIQGKRQQDEVRAGEEFAARHLAQAEPLLGLCIQSLRLVVLVRSRPSLQALSHGQSDGAHAKDADRSVIQPRAVELWLPALELARADERICCPQMPPQPHRQSDRQLGSRDRQQIRHEGQPDPAGSTGVHIEIVEALERAADYTQLRAGLKKVCIDPIGMNAIIA